MKEERIVITADNDGNTKIDVQGVVGKRCLDLTTELEKELGIVTKRTEKPEIKKREAITRVNQNINTKQ